VVVTVAATAALFGTYAIDDSYIGFSNAQNLAAGHGFVFSPGQPALTTSAPLAVFVYAAFWKLFHWDIVRQSQYVSACSIVAIAALSYAIVRRLASSKVAAVTSITLTASPLILLLWSHESLPALALSLGAVYAVLAGRAAIAAVCLGIATVLRPESFILLPLLAFAIYGQNRRTAWTFAIISCIPYALWALYALPTFGTAFSQSIQAKHAELVYGDTSYAYGMYARPEGLYAKLIGIRYVRALFIPLSAAAALVLLAFAPWRLIYRYLGLWVILTTALYLVAQVPFFYWFGLQIPVAIAAVAGALTYEPFRNPIVRAVARVLLFAIVALNLGAFARLVLDPALKFSPLDTLLVMPKVDDNNYYRLALWLRGNTSPDDSVAYPEIGQLRYYSQRSIVDYEGLGTPGIAREYLESNAIWPFERYRPSIYVQEPGFWSFLVDPTEYDWFTRAYIPVTSLHFPGSFRNHFVVWKLKDASAIPPPERVDTAASRSLQLDRTSELVFRTQLTLQSTDAFEVRARGECSNGKLSVLDGNRVVASRRFTLSGPDPKRVRIDVSPLSPATVTVVVSGCSDVIAVPPLALRTFSALYTNARRKLLPPAYALVIYGRS
jgi:hypothetical protein